MTHLSADELIDAVEAVLAPSRRAHLSVCKQCRRELAQLSSVLIDTRQVSVPEPSPLFWRHFSERVRASIDEAAPVGAWPSWLRWQVLAPVGALTLVLALALAVPRHSPSDDAGVALDSPDAADALTLTDSWGTLAQVVGDLDLDAAAAAGWMTAPGVTEQAVLDLTVEEQQELTRLLRAELTRAKS